jgi:hypothetical protein
MPGDETADDPEIQVHFNEREGRFWVECDASGFRRFSELLQEELAFLSPEERAKVTFIEIADIETWKRRAKQQSSRDQVTFWLWMSGVAILFVLASIGVREVWSWIRQLMRRRILLRRCRIRSSTLSHRLQPVVSL